MVQSVVPDYFRSAVRENHVLEFSRRLDFRKIGQDVNGLNRPKSGEGWTYCSSVGANRILISVFLNALECFERETIPG